MTQGNKVDAQSLQDRVSVELTSGFVGLTEWRGLRWFVYLSNDFTVTHAFRF